MAIPKSKLAILIGAMKPKGDDEGDEKEEKSEGCDSRFHEVAVKMVDAVKDGDVEALCECLEKLQDIDKEEDVAAEESEDEEY
jgi:hypothetical protein